MRLIAFRTPDVPFMQIASQVIDLLMHKSYNGTCESPSLLSMCQPVSNRQIRYRWQAVRTILQQIIPLVLAFLAIGRRETVIAPLPVLSVALFRQSAGQVAERVAPSYPGVVGEGVACVVGIGGRIRISVRHWWTGGGRGTWPSTKIDELFCRSWHHKNLSTLWCLGSLPRLPLLG